jgi:glucosamine--fructose-6-phosphate aminotransferase (isomerizing)
MLYKAGLRLIYRGYDSVGVGVVEGSKIDLRKDVGTVEEVAERLRFEEMAGDRGIVQLRWATFGKPSKANSQPHTDCKGELLGAHTGTSSTREN